MIQLIRSDASHPDFIQLVQLLDAELAGKYENQTSFYAQFNGIEQIKHVVLLYEDGEPVSCGSIKEYESQVMEVKRMFTKPNSRGKGFAALILKELVNWATALGYQKCILETGKRQPEAIALYQKNGFTLIPNYGQYVGADYSVCFEKSLI